jgi:ATP-dependent RNA helicase RhlE
MDTFKDFNITKQLANAIDDLGFETPTPIQVEAFPVILSGKNVVGIAQTGTGKTLAYTLPLLRELKYSEDPNPRVLILVPTRELVTQVVEQVEALAKYMTLRILGVSGGVNIRTQKQRVAETGANILVATPRRLYDLVMHKAIRLSSVKKLVIDEVDVMLDLGFRYQLTNLFDLLPARRQNIMFSATMTDDIDALINDFFLAPERISVAVSGTPLDNIAQSAYRVANYHTKVNLLSHLIRDRSVYRKVLVFAPSKRIADRMYEALEEEFGSEVGVIHGNKSQNYRSRTIEEFEQGDTRVLVSTDVMARGLDLEKITQVINFDVPAFPENYLHRIGRTGRAEEPGQSILFFTEKEEPWKLAIEELMDYQIPLQDFPEEVEVSAQLAPEERPEDPGMIDLNPHKKKDDRGPAFHEKKKKNQKTNAGGGKKKKLKLKKYKKPITRGDKVANKRKGK